MSEKGNNSELKLMEQIEGGGRKESQNEKELDEGGEVDSQSGQAFVSKDLKTSSLDFSLICTGWRG